MAKYIELNNEVKIPDENGRLQYHKDKEAVHSYFLDHVNEKMRYFHDREEQLDYMFKNDYYDKAIFDQYSSAEVNEIFNMIYGEKFRFQSFMSAYKFYNNYALKDNKGIKYLERYEDRLAVVALFLAQGDFEKAQEFAEVLVKQGYQPATPTFLNAGRSRAGELVSCFLIEVPDSTEGIMYASEASAQLSRMGGGVALNLSKLRGAGDAIKDIEDVSTSIVGIAKILEGIFNKFNQLGQRQGSGAVYLNVFHSDVMDLLDTKKINVDDNIRLKTLSVGLIMPDKFYELAEKNEPFFTFYPYSVFKEYGVHLDDMDMSVMYDELLNNPNVRKKQMMNPRKFLTEIAKTQIESGYPYLMNRDNVKKAHLLNDIGEVKMSNLCVEILQLQLPSDIQSYKGVDTFGRDISCNLGSLNIVSVMESGIFAKTVRASMDMLNAVADMTSISEVPTVKLANDDFHSVGLGAMNLHGYLAKNSISYESEEAKDFANTFFMMVRFYALQRSMEIAREKGTEKKSKPFKGFEKSDYAKGTALTKYIENSYAPKTAKVAQLFEGIYIPNQTDWSNLNHEIMTHGIYNAYIMAIAPTGSISYVHNATPSVMPIVEKIETRTYGDSTTHYPMPYLSPKTFWFYKSAYDMDMFKVIDLIATIQEHVDQGISFTLFVDGDEITTGKLARNYIYAHKKGIKTLYYTRTKKSSNEECLSCVV
ncbi:class 1b ribonucleoside-diphosphate reductase subunit alpha [Bacillus cereus]|uniref:Ribonucleoside-diphosphate reductase n=1 Tax=Bacillus cereus TaxID=1396 RepID=A0A9X6UC13_BACCE|nr:class 1b ribonucleoside-diphosphate reductase subunit alpha [Bacillus cereus]EOO44231.1 ribonucleoside-diphosphate reductase, alpha subunit [Bacillus cereus BAG1X2-2]EOP00370.1 ribonucleoside-diphosphate reductase, alpha subunit [Bacillus cereus BAG2O-1]PEN97882.1 class 1b ribonucleoside-diphosphate reductase subunit alpha [Bacillus cereus]